MKNKMNILTTFLVATILLSCVPGPNFNVSVNHSDNLIVDDNLNFKKGIYKTYEEFKTNSPSISLEYDVLSGIINYDVWQDICIDTCYKTDTCYTLKIEKAKTKEIGKVWGFCDGKYVYINRDFSPYAVGGIIFRPVSKFYKVLFIGRYCYANSGMTVNGRSYHLTLGFDFNTGKLFEACESKIKSIVSKDDELFLQFKIEPLLNIHYNVRCFKYLKLYSEKHKDEIIR